MTYTSLNHIVKSVLNQRGYSIHWYFQFLKHAADGYRELHFDTLLNIQTVKIPVNAHNAVPIPCDYVDMVKFGVIAGQLVKPLTQQSGINRLNAFDDAGEITTYDQSTDTSDDIIWGNAYVDILHNDYEEHVGRMFGYKDSGMGDGFKVLPERGEIQLSESIVADYVILEYIGNGSHTDAATKIDAYAQAAIEAYIKWKSTRGAADNIFSTEAITYQGEVRKLRARKNPLTVDDIKRIMSRSKSGAPKG